MSDMFFACCYVDFSIHISFHFNAPFILYDYGKEKKKVSRSRKKDEEKSLSSMGNLAVDSAKAKSACQMSALSNAPSATQCLNFHIFTLSSLKETWFVIWSRPLTDTSSPLTVPTLSRVSAPF